MANLPLNLVKKLYHEDGLSTLEIAGKLKITPWIVQKFMVKNNLPRRTFKEANEKRFEKKPLTFFIKQELSLREKELKTAGIILYWAEGTKFNPINRNCTVDFANSNPAMVKIFLKFLREICGTDEKRLRIYLYCYTNQYPKFLQRYWSKTTKIPLNQFTKPYIRKDFLQEKSGKMKYGLVHVRYSDKKLLLQIEKWIEEYIKICNI